MASLDDRLRHWRFRALRSAAPVSGGRLGVAAAVCSHRDPSWRCDGRSSHGRPPGRTAKPRRRLRRPDGGCARGLVVVLVLYAFDDLGTLLVELHCVLLERFLLAVFQILALVVL